MQKEEGGYRTSDGSLWLDRHVASVHEQSLDKNKNWQPQSGSGASRESLLSRLSGFLAKAALVLLAVYFLNVGVTMGGLYWALMIIPFVVVYLGVVLHHVLPAKVLLIIQLAIVAVSIGSLYWVFDQYIL